MLCFNEQKFMKFNAVQYIHLLLLLHFVSYIRNICLSQNNKDIVLCFLNLFAFTFVFDTLQLNFCIMDEAGSQCLFYFIKTSNNYRTIYWRTVHFLLNCCGAFAIWFHCSIYYVCLHQCQSFSYCSIIESLDTC